ncbi:hypothetical protein Clacol_000865 [Clathrus columnatus]|uniref:DUF803-domain-containing protein n=1 Tax=Clathrus columnatus TaxID=1419009 RepID=A0AAV5A441_9AGAM|nr:hypothetical protein Clacol_000865 [Clathrus columnatus]
MASSPTSTSSTGVPQLPSSFKIVGLLIGCSFVFKKKGLLRSTLKTGNELGEGVAYLKSPMWWTGEFCNFAAYAFVPAVVVTPLGALSVVICAVLSSIFLNEKLTFFGWLGCALCIVGSIIIALNGPQEATVGHIKDFEKLFLAPGFLAFGGVLIATSLVIIIYFIPRYGKKNMLWCIMVCSMIGGLSVSTTTGLGGAIVTTIFLHENQAITEVYYLNMALALFNTAMVTPTYYVIFTGFTLVTSVKPVDQSQLISGLVPRINGHRAGITILQMSKVDPTQLKKLDRRSTMLLQASRTFVDGDGGEKSLSGAEDPGMDALRGSFGAFGSIVRAKSVKHLSRSMSTMNQSGGGAGLPQRRHGIHPRGDDVSPIERHQLYDAPVPPRPDSTITTGGKSDNISISSTSVAMSSPPPRSSTIKFGEEDVEHYYPSSRKGADRLAPRHQHHPRDASSPGSILIRHDRTPSPLRKMTEESHYSEEEEEGLRNTERGAFKTTFTDPFNVSTEPLSISTPRKQQQISYDDADVPPQGTLRGHPIRTGSKGTTTPLKVNSPRTPRQYPSGTRQEDREQSISLVHDTSEPEGDVDADDGSVESPEDEMLRTGGIRLLSTNTRI